MQDASKINPVGSTALMVAHLRAIEANRPDKLFEDPFASVFADEQLAATMDGWLAQSEVLSALLRVRIRWVDDMVERALAQGIEQVVVLGAGCCTRAERFARPNVTFYEIDQAEVLAFKMSRLASAGHPYGAIGVPMDYTKPGQMEALPANGVQPTRKTLVLWEANSYYLLDSALRAVLRTLSELFPDVILVMDYLGPEVIRGESASPWMRSQAERLKSYGAPFLGSIEDMSRLAGEIGFQVEEERSFRALKDRMLPYLELGADEDLEYTCCVLTRPRPSQ